MKKIAVFCLAVLILLGAGSCTQQTRFPEPENYTESDVPYDYMTEEDRHLVKFFWDEGKSDCVPAGSPGLQNAIRSGKSCVYVTQLGGLMTTQDVPEDADYLGLTKAPCEACTTPQEELQTNFAPAGCKVYKGLWTVRSDDRSRTFDMYFVQQEPDAAHYSLMYVSSATRPPYYDEGRWMLRPRVK